MKPESLKGQRSEKDDEQLHSERFGYTREATDRSRDQRHAEADAGRSRSHQTRHEDEVDHATQRPVGAITNDGPAGGAHLQAGQVAPVVGVSHRHSG
jgi:hypothetical protein